MTDAPSALCCGSRPCPSAFPASGARQMSSSTSARRGPWAARRERRRQVDAPEDPVRRADARCRHDRIGTGETVSHHDAAEAQALGIVTIYQEFNLVPTLTVAENVFIGREPGVSAASSTGGACAADARAHHRPRSASTSIPTPPVSRPFGRRAADGRDRPRALDEVAASSSWTSRPRRCSRPRSTALSASCAT